MASNTPNLNLLKKDPATDGNDTFNIQTMLNDNWDKIDAAVGEVREELKDINVPDASLTQKGITQLSSATDNTAEDRAATPKAVKAAYDAATAAQVTANAANTAAASAGNAVGPLSSLLTSAKGNVVSAVNELFTNVNDGKNVIASAIIGRGGTASGSDTFSQLAAAIRNLKGNVAMGSFSRVFTSDLSITESVSGLSFTPRYIFIRLDTVAFPGNQTRFLGLISNQSPLNFIIGLGARADLVSFIPTSGGFTVTVNFGITDSRITQLGSQLHDWIAVE
ncbi:phage tail protein [Paenibacillus sp. TH7-28]